MTRAVLVRALRRIPVAIALVIILIAYTAIIGIVTGEA
jgi:hypothetical protein